MGNMRQFSLQKNIALIGMPGCSKTTTGKVLAELLNREFIDTDKVYESVYGEAISVTFQTSGEEVFRDRESALLRDVCQKQNTVLATGGGIILREANRMLLRQTCAVVELYASVQTIFDRVKTDSGRPLLAHMDSSTIAQLYEKRGDLYRSCAHVRICTDDIPPSRIADKIMDGLTEYFHS